MVNINLKIWTNNWLPDQKKKREIVLGIKKAIDLEKKKNMEKRKQRQKSKSKQKKNV